MSGDQELQWQRERRNARRIAAAIFVVMAVIGLLAGVAERYYRRRVELRATTTSPREVSWEHRTLRSGDRIRIARWAGTFKPEETGAAVEVDAGPGRTGVVLRGDARPYTRHLDVDPNEPVQIVRVRWDAQSWKENGGERLLALQPFEATIHVSYLELVQ